MSIKQRMSDTVALFTGIEDWQERYKKIIEMGKDLPEMREEFKIEANKVKGCQSQVWLGVDFKDGLIYFEGDSDAAIVKGIVAVLLSVYSGSTPDEILSTRPTFIEDIGLKQHLSMSRANGLNFMVKQITIYAMAFKAKAQMGAK